MLRLSPHRLFGVFSALAIAAAAIAGTGGAASLAASATNRHTLPRFVSIGNETLPQVAAHEAAYVAPRNGGAPLLISLGLPIRNEARLNAFLTREARGASPLTHQQFDRLYGESPTHVASVIAWARSHGLSVIYHSPDGLTLTVRGTTRAVESTFDITINSYRLDGHGFFANASNPVLPARLGIQTVVGLNDLQHAQTLNVRSDGVRGPNGYLPKDMRAAYDVSQHHGGGAGQTIGFTLWGAPDTNSDLARFSVLTGDPKISACATGTGTSTPSACKGAHAANTIQWVQVAGKSNDISGLDETAMDVEYAHGISANSHLKYFLGGDGSNAQLAAAISAATNDPTLRIVSNSWGGGDKVGDSFVKTTTNSFKEADAVGTTFFFSSGDSANDSGCPRSGSQRKQLCGAPSYPADSPYVVAVGGTDLQMNSGFTGYQSETAWNNLQFFDNNNNFSVQGGGSGCESGFARPSFQQRVAGVATNAGCGGRAEPDVAANADPASGVVVVATTLSKHKKPQQQTFQEGGTSLAAPLWTGMMADTFNFDAGHNRRLQWKRGWLLPQIYKTAQTSLYNTYFHDVVCGYDGSPAALGWDQATGWGSPDWFALTEGLAGISIPASGKAPTNCELTGSVSSVEKKLVVPLAGWPTTTLTSTAKGGVQTASFLDNGNSNFFRQFQAQSYAHFGVLGNFAEGADVKIASDSSPFGEWLATYYPNTADAANLVANAAAFTHSHFNATVNDCSISLNNIGDSTPDCREFQDQGKDAQGNTWDLIAFMFAINNAVGEVQFQAPDATVGASQVNFNAWLKDGATIARAGVLTLNAAGNTVDPFPTEPGTALPLQSVNLTPVHAKGLRSFFQPGQRLPLR